MKLLLTALLLQVSLTPLARADTLDRINECERRGGGTCVFDILRELAGKSGGSGEIDSFTFVGQMSNRDLTFPVSASVETTINNCLTTYRSQIPGNGPNNPYGYVWFGSYRYKNRGGAYNFQSLGNETDARRLCSDVFDLIRRAQ